jgi:HK97 family phage major capsid protein
MTNAAVVEAKTGMRRLALKAQETVDDAALTQVEKKEALDKLEVDLKAFSDTIALWEQAERLTKGGDLADVAAGAASEEKAIARAKGIGHQFVDSDAYKNVVMRAYDGGRSRFDASVDIKVPGIIDEGTTFANGFPTGSYGAAVLPDFLPVVDLRFRKLAIADLFAQGSTTSNQISYLKETAFNNSAAGVAEKAKKPLSDDVVARVIEQVGKIAHIFKLTDEMMQDAAQLVSYIQNRMIFGVHLKEDSELLYGGGYPSVSGLMGRTGFQTNIAAAGTDALGGATAVIDAVYKQITAIRFNAFVEPDAVLLDPINWQHVQLGKDQNGQYYAGGPFLGSYGNGQASNVHNFWGLRAVVTPAINDGKITVGGFQEGGQIFRRQGVTIEMTNSNVDDFENNLVTGRAEERLALAVYRAGAFGQITPTWT